MNWTDFIQTFFGAAIVATLSIFGCMNTLLFIIIAFRRTKKAPDENNENIYEYYLEREKGTREYYESVINLKNTIISNQKEKAAMLSTRAIEMERKAMENCNKEFITETMHLGLVSVFKIDQDQIETFNTINKLKIDGNYYYLYAKKIEKELAREDIEIPERSLFGNTLILKNSLNITPKP